MDVSEKIYALAADYQRLHPFSDLGVLALVSGLGDLAALTSVKAAMAGVETLAALLFARADALQARRGDLGLAKALILLVREYDA